MRPLSSSALVARLVLACSAVTALGAAHLAGLAVGFWQTREEVAAQWTCERRFDPVMGADRRGALMEGWARAVDRSKGWAA